ncbi:MAG: hypothetical protein E6Q24_18095 [Chitinophagaceae bacterium]|nr:MAG: hypothetical protein E6Q24_18095 [Chitinophagaceae bacterium]
MRHRSIQFIWSVSFFCLFSINANSQSDSIRREFITSLSQDLLRYYVYAKDAERMADTIKMRFENGLYNKAKNIDEFAYEITLDLRRIGKDRHLTVTSPQADFFDNDGYQRRLMGLTQKQVQAELNIIKKKMEEQKKWFLEDNYSYGDVKMLPGKVGYLKIKNFEGRVSPEKGKSIRIADVVNFLKKSTSIILDLRDNSGGNVEQVGRFVSYFIGLPNKYLFTIQMYVRYDSNGIQKESEVTKKYFSSPQINNNHLEKKKLIILINSRTFSAAESVVYLLKKNCSATIIGEKTVGATHIYGNLLTRKHYTAIIPTGKCIDEERVDFPLEGEGVQPDIYAKEDSAYEVAYRIAIANRDVSGSKIEYLNREGNIFTGEYLPSFSEYTGDYFKAKIFRIDKQLFIDYDGQHREVLMLKSKDLFKSESFMSIDFFRDSKNKVIGVTLKHNEGFLEVFFLRS